MRLLFPDTELMSAVRFASVAHVPFLLDDDGTYLDAPNRYMRERALLEWLPEEAFSKEEKRPSKELSYPTVDSLRTMGERLKNFLEWCAFKKLDWRVADYTKHIVGGYQVAMTRGDWSRSGKPLDGKTINSRANEATLFLAWSAQTGLRAEEAVPFRVPTWRAKRRTSDSPVKFNKATGFTTRAGQVSEKPPHFALPTPEEVGTWLKRVYVTRGPVKGLCCELILETGIRIRECVRWRADYLPEDRSKWRVRGRKVLVCLSAGTKGRRVEPDAVDGPARWISVPLDLAERLHRYAQEERPSQHARWVRSAKTPEERAKRRRQGLPPELFLGERCNRPFSTRMLRRIWSETPGCGDGWHPHLGRHYFACHRLIDVTLKKVKAAGRELGQLNSDWLMGSLRSDITMVLRPQLGHVSEKTTNEYLGWLQDWFEACTDQGPLRWQDYLERGACHG